MPSVFETMLHEHEEHAAHIQDYIENPPGGEHDAESRLRVARAVMEKQTAYYLGMIAEQTTRLAQSAAVAERSATNSLLLRGNGARQ